MFYLQNEHAHALLAVFSHYLYADLLKTQSPFSHDDGQLCAGRCFVYRMNMYNAPLGMFARVTYMDLTDTAGRCVCTVIYVLSTG
jgi:hypothetical protein